MSESHNGYVRWSGLVRVSLTVVAISFGLFYFSSNRLDSHVEKLVPRTEFKLVMESLSEIKANVKENGKQINDINLKVSRLEFKNFSTAKNR